MGEQELYLEIHFVWLTGLYGIGVLASELLTIKHPIKSSIKILLLKYAALALLFVVTIPVIEIVITGIAVAVTIFTDEYGGNPQEYLGGLKYFAYAQSFGAGLWMSIIVEDILRRTVRQNKTTNKSRKSS